MYTRIRRNENKAWEDESARFLGDVDEAVAEDKVLLDGPRSSQDNIGKLLISERNSDDKRPAIVRAVVWWCRSFFLVVGITASLIAALFLYFYILRTGIGPTRVNGERFEFEQKQSKIETMENSIIKEFPGFFRDYKEQEKIAGIVDQSSMEGAKPISPESESIGSEGFHSHGCCLSQGKFWTPEEGHDIQRQKRKILQFPNFKQFFYHETTRLTRRTEENNLFEDEQGGFTKGRSTLDQISSLTNIIETRKRYKYAPRSTPLVKKKNTFNQRCSEQMALMMFDNVSPMISDVLADCALEESDEDLEDLVDSSFLDAMAALQEQQDRGAEEGRTFANEFNIPYDVGMIADDAMWSCSEGDQCPEEVLLEVEVISSWEEGSGERTLTNLDHGSQSPNSQTSHSEYSDYGSDNGADHNTSELDLSHSGSLDLSRTSSYTEQTTAIDYSQHYPNQLPNGSLDLSHTNTDMGLHTARYMHSGGSLVLNRSGEVEQHSTLLDLSKTGSYYQMPRIKLEPGLGIDPSIQIHYNKPEMDYNHNEAFSSLSKVDPAIFHHNPQNAYIPKSQDIEEYSETQFNQSDAHYREESDAHYREELQNQQCQNIPLTVTSPDDDNDSGTESVCSKDSDKSNSNQNNKKRPGRKKGQVSKVYHLWEFIRDVLADPKYCPTVIKWENEEEGIFRVVQSEVAAQLWGQKKNNRTKMTYEKMSRSIRYSRKEGYFDDIPKDKGYPKKLCFKFGKKAHGWSQRYKK